MDRNARNAYLETEVTTATPQKLRLMLIDGSLRFARLTLDHWENGRDLDARDACRRCRDVLLELFSSLKTDHSEIANQTADVYLFLIRAITQAEADGDPVHVDQVIRVLEIERGTWQQVCEKFSRAIAADEAREIKATGLKSIPPVDVSRRRAGDQADHTSAHPYADQRTPQKGLRLEG